MRLCNSWLATVSMLMAACAASTANSQDAADARKQRMDFMKQKMAEFQLSFQVEPNQPLSLTASPVLRFSNPVRDSFSDGAVFLWLKGKRPVAAASLWIRSSSDFGRDFTSLTDDELQCLHKGKIEWSPRAGGVIRARIVNAPRPAQTAPLRLAQMRKLAGRFSGEIGAWPAEGFRELRLMPRPIYRYDSEEDGVADGAVFALSLANDPEVLVQLELAEPSSGSLAWSYALARMSALRMRVRFDDREIWKADGYWRKPRSPNDPYMEVLGGKYEPVREFADD